MTKEPCVFIVGAGPGDPGLITVRGQRCLESADVVIYDHQVHQRLLRFAPAEAEKIDVGPAAPRPLDQEAISLLLAEKARERRVVVRLKWGDPFVFDSGGKEALFLHEQGIPFQVVPGVPAAVGIPAYAGIPVTYPGAGDLVTLVRGDESGSGDSPAVDWATLARSDGTVMCYAGAAQITRMVEALLANGRSPEETAALIYRGTSAGQQTIVAQLGAIAGHARQNETALLVIGAVAGLREHLRWFDDRPLFGRRIVVTRSREQATEVVDMLEERGAEAIHAPAIRIAPPEDVELLDAACEAVATFDWLILTSVNAADYFMRRLLAVSDIRELKGVRICTIGASTAERVRRYGIRVDLVPEEYHAEALIDALRGQDAVAGRRYLLPKADIARELLADELRAHGAIVTDIVAYRTLLASTERDSDQDVYRMLLDRQIDAVTFTSPSSVRNFVKMLGEDQAVDLLQATVVACIGPVTAEAAQQLGIATTVMPERFTVADLVDALVAHFHSPIASATP
jgi:uroporphyrinogen III methyltransferase/synthase